MRNDPLFQAEKRTDIINKRIQLAVWSNRWLAILVLAIWAAWHFCSCPATVDPGRSRSDSSLERTWVEDLPGERVPGLNKV